MLNVHQILVSACGPALVVVGLAGCGQKGSLYLPTDPAAKGRATLPELLLPTPPAPATPASPGTPGAAGAQEPPSKAPANAGSAPAGAGR
jgi:predicted small lipoprotein YifL